MSNAGGASQGAHHKAALDGAGQDRLAADVIGRRSMASLPSISPSAADTFVPPPRLLFLHHARPVSLLEELTAVVKTAIL